MTKEIDISTMVNSKEILPQYCDQLETEIKDIFFMGNRSKYIHGDDKNSKRKRTQLPTAVQAVHLI